MSEKTEEKKKKKKMAILWLYVVILLLIIGLLIYLYFLNKDDVNIALNISETQTAIDSSTKFRVLNKEDESEYVELVGYGLLEIDKEYPNIYLENPSDNNAYLSFDVVYKDKILYQSDLIEPGNMDIFNIYDCLDAGQHSISYVISAYRISNKKPYWTGVEQIQEINITK